MAIWNWLSVTCLLKARLLQRSCHIADSYRLLYDIGQSGVLEENDDNLLYNYAQTEYYITLLTLNFHYRNGKEQDVMSTIREVERRREGLKVDYAQDMALNYALAYGLQSAGESLKALEYCDVDILDRLLYGQPRYGERFLALQLCQPPADGRLGAQEPARRCGARQYPGAV